MLQLTSMHLLRNSVKTLRTTLFFIFTFSLVSIYPPKIFADYITGFNDISGMFQPGDMKGMKQFLKFEYIDIRPTSEPHQYEYTAKITNVSNTPIENWSLQVSLSSELPKNAVIMKTMKNTGGHGFAGRKLNPGESQTFTKSVTVDFDMQKIWSASYGTQELVPRTLMFILKLRDMNNKNTKTYNGIVYNGNVGIIIKPVACKKGGKEYLTDKLGKKIARLFYVQTRDLPRRNSQQRKQWSIKIANFSNRGQNLKVIAKTKGLHGNWITRKAIEVSINPNDKKVVSGILNFHTHEINQLQVAIISSSNHKAWKRICID